MRKARPGDSPLYLEWANDPVVREGSFHSEPISPEVHEAWFARRLADGGSFLYLFEWEGSPCGQVRIQVGEEPVIGVSTDPRFRGRGIGTYMLKAAAAAFFGESDQDYILAYIKEDNGASLKLFERAGYLPFRRDTVNGIPCVVRILKRDE